MNPPSISFKKERVSNVHWSNDLFQKSLLKCKLGRYNNKLNLVEFYCIAW